VAVFWPDYLGKVPANGALRLFSTFLEIPLTALPAGANLAAMDLESASAARLLSQLGNETRLRIVRLLVRAGRSGMTVGEIQKELDIPNSTLSHHLTSLRHVGLVEQRRESTVLRCLIDYEQINAIVDFLTRECCAAEREQKIC
jgi:DNA-binding transcriptional ArsR family regulator